MTRQSKISSNDLTCKWCDKTFAAERTLLTHMCVKKRRWADKDMTHVRLAYRVFQMFYEYTTNNAKAKTQEDFVKSSYYMGFVKFGRSCLVNEYLNPESFAEWLIKKGQKLTDWSKDKTYDEYLLQYVRKEPGLKALERTVSYLATWGEDTGIPWQDYFEKVSTNRAVHDIRSAKISPWVLYLSNTGDKLLTRFNTEQVKIIEPIIDASFWMGVFKSNTEEVGNIQEICTAANI